MTIQTKNRQAFTLVEVTISITILGLVLAAIVPAFSYFSQSISRLGNYAILSQDSREALEYLRRDLYAAESMTTAQPDRMTVQLPAELDDMEVTYIFSRAENSLFREVTDLDGTTIKKILFEDIDQFEFVYFNRLGVDVTEEPSVLLQTKNVQIRASLRKYVLSTDTSDLVVSARFLMRNVN